MGLLGYIGLGLCIIAGVAAGYLIGSIPRRRKEEEYLQQAHEEVERLKAATLLEGQREIQKLRDELEDRSKRREEEFSRMEERILQREDRLGKKSNYLEQIEDSLRKDEDEVELLKKEGGELLDEARAQLERVSGWSRDEAREHLLQVVESESQHFLPQDRGVRAQGTRGSSTARRKDPRYSGATLRGRVCGGTYHELRPHPVGGVQGPDHWA